MKLTDKQQTIIKTLGYDSPQQFLLNYPYRYDFLETKPRNQWEVKDQVVFEGELVSPFRHVRFGKNRSVTHFQVMHEFEIIKVSIFNRPYLNASHYKNAIVVIGSVQKDGSVVASAVTNKPLDDVLGIKPIYPLKAGIKNHEVHRLIMKILKEETVSNDTPNRFVSRYQLLPLSKATEIIHNPTSKVALEAALRTLKYDEFLRYHISVAINNRHLDFGIERHYNESRLGTVVGDLPYVLSDGQETSLNEILSDLRSNRQMNRLLQGDVGSGKTIVAFLAALATIESGYQVAFLSPTEILTLQHGESFQTLFGNEAQSDVLTTNSEDRDGIIARLKSGETKIIFGTHALFSDDAVFKKLGLVIIDEQHRFGVKQRQSLLEKGDHVDALMLSATPIPRTLANSLFFDLDVSSITNYPKHRKQPVTHIVKENSIRTLLDVIAQTLKSKGQIYVVCAAIEDGERENVRSVFAMHQQIQGLFPEASVGMLHGKMAGTMKETVMTAFKHRSIDILVSTTVIEVGVDVHNANLMIIYNAEQFGLATLHQLRGRVGRGDIQGVCYLLSGSDSETSGSRLQALESSYDGFELAMEDMRLRGYGDALGIRQSGLPSFILGDIETDEKILRQAKLDAKEIVEDIHNEEFQEIIKRVQSQDYFITM